MKVCIVIPAYKEENRIKRTLETYCTYFDEQYHTTTIDYELLVVINGPKDNTLSVVQNMIAIFPKIKVFDIEHAGKGLAIAAGFHDALQRNNDYIGFVDADMATSPQFFYELILNMHNHDGIIASRYMRGSTVVPQRPWIKYWGRKLVYDNLVYCLFGLPFHDYQCGAKLFKKSVIEKITPHLRVGQWAFDVELLYLCKRFGFKVTEIPTVWHDQDGSKLKIMGSGMRMLKSVVQLRLHYSPLRFGVKQQEHRPS